MKSEVMLLPYKPFVFQLRNSIISLEMKKTFLGLFLCSCKKNKIKDYNEYFDEKVLLVKEIVVTCDYNENDMHCDTGDHVKYLENETKFFENVKDTSGCVLIKKDIESIVVPSLMKKEKNEMIFLVNIGTTKNNIIEEKKNDKTVIDLKNHDGSNKKSSQKARNFFFAAATVYSSVIPNRGAARTSQGCLQILN